MQPTTVEAAAEVLLVMQAQAARAATDWQHRTQVVQAQVEAVEAVPVISTT
jgi:hypothetical protein